MAGNATNWPFKLIFYVFKHKCYPMKMLNIAFQMQYVRRLFWHSFRHWFNFFRDNLQDQKCKKWSFMGPVNSDGLIQCIHSLNRMIQYSVVSLPVVATNTLGVYGEETRTLLTKCLYNASRVTWYERSCGLLCCAGSRGAEGEVWEAKLTCTSEYEIADEFWD